MSVRSFKGCVLFCDDRWVEILLRKIARIHVNVIYLKYFYNLAVISTIFEKLKKTT